MGRAWRTIRMAALALLLLGAPRVWAADDGSEQVPQGPAPAPGPVMAPSEVVGYRPIPESMLPGMVNPGLNQTGMPQAAMPSPTNLGGPAMQMGPYTLGPDDIIYIEVTGQPEFTGRYVVGTDGKIQYGFVGDIPADGLTKEQLASAVAEKLQKYVRVPSVYVTIVGFNSKAIYILGEVARPGKYAMRGDSIKIRDAVIAAGLITTRAALSRVHVIKSDPKDPSYKVLNLKNVLFKGIMRDNIELVTGDIVVIPSTVLSGINTFLSNLLSPVSKGASVAALATL